MGILKQKHNIIFEVLQHKLTKFIISVPDCLLNICKIHVFWIILVLIMK